MPTRLTPRFVIPLAFVLGLIATTLATAQPAGSPKPAKDKEGLKLFLKDVQVAFSPSADATTAAPKSELNLRPNLVNHVHTYLVSTLNVEIKVFAGLYEDAEGKKLLAVSDAITLPKQADGGKAKVVWKVVGKPTPPSDPKAEAPKGPTLTLPGKLYVRLSDEVLGDKDNGIDKGSFALSILSPSELVKQNTASGKVEKDIASLKITIKLPEAKTLDGYYSKAPIKMKLNLRPDLNKHLGPVARYDEASLEVTVPFETNGDPNQPDATLFVNGLKLDEPKPVTVSLDIDGYARAMMFEIGNSQTGENKKVEVYVRAEETLMAPGKPFRVFFEPYLITRSDWKLNRVLTAKSGTPLSEMLKKGSTLYDQSVTVTAAEDGSLALSTAHADWSVSIPTAGLAGKFNYQAELLNDGGEKKSSNSVTVTVDPSKPEGVSLDEIPNDKWITGTALSLSAKGNDSLSGIAKVWFYVGDPPTAEGKGATVVAGIKLSDGVYQAERPILLPEQKGDVRVGVLMVNGVGMTAGAEKTLTVRIPPGEKKDGSGKTTGTITGKVVFGYLGKSNLPVELQDASGKAVKTATSAADGTFKFEDVLPGSYTVTSTNKADHNAKGEAKTSVEAGKTSTVEVRLKR